MQGGMFEFFYVRKQQLLEHISGKSGQSWNPDPAPIAENEGVLDPIYEPNSFFDPLQLDEDPIVVDQPLNLLFDDTEPIPFCQYPNGDSQYMQETGPEAFINMVSQPHQQTQNIHEQSSSHYTGGHGFPSNAFYGNSSTQTVTNNRVHSSYHTSQQMSALSTDFGSSSGFGWDNMCHMNEQMPGHDESNMESW